MKKEEDKTIIKPIMEELDTLTYSAGSSNTGSEMKQSRAGIPKKRNFESISEMSNEESMGDTSLEVREFQESGISGASSGIGGGSGSLIMRKKMMVLKATDTTSSSFKHPTGQSLDNKFAEVSDTPPEKHRKQRSKSTGHGKPSLPPVSLGIISNLSHLGHQVGHIGNIGESSSGRSNLVTYKHQQHPLLSSVDENSDLNVETFRSLGSELELHSTERMRRDDLGSSKPPKMTKGGKCKSQPNSEGGSPRAVHQEYAATPDITFSGDNEEDQYKSPTPSRIRQKKKQAKGKEMAYPLRGGFGPSSGKEPSTGVTEGTRGRGYTNSTAATFSTREHSDVKFPISTTLSNIHTLPGDSREPKSSIYTSDTPDVHKTEDLLASSGNTNTPESSRLYACSLLESHSSLLALSRIKERYRGGQAQPLPSDRESKPINIMSPVNPLESPNFKVSELNVQEPVSNRPQNIGGVRASGPLDMQHLKASHSERISSEYYKQGESSNQPKSSTDTTGALGVEDSLRYVSQLKETKFIRELTNNPDNYKEHLKDFSCKYIDNRLPDHLKSYNCPSRLFRNKFHDRFMKQCANMIENEMCANRHTPGISSVACYSYKSASGFVPNYYMDAMAQSVRDADYKLNSSTFQKKEENLQLQNKHQMKDEYVWLHAYGSDHWRDADKMHNKRRIFNDDWEMTRRWKCSDCEYTSELKLNCTREELGPPPLCLNEIEGKSQKFAKLLVELQKKVEENISKIIMEGSTDEMAEYLKKEFDEAGVTRGTYSEMKVGGFSKSGVFAPRGGGTTIDGAILGKSAAEVFALKEKLEMDLEVKFGINNADIKLKTIAPGLKFIPIPKSTLLSGGVESPTQKVIEHIPGEILLVDFWATWCGPCQEPMAHNEKMLVENAEWVGKVRIVALGMDDDSAPLLEKIKGKCWEKVEHYHLAGGFNNPGAKSYAVEGIPHCILVGNDGIIQLIGHPNSINLDINIPKLLGGETLIKEEGVGDGSAQELSEISKIPIEDVRDKLKEYLFTNNNIGEQTIDMMCFLVRTFKINISTQAKSLKTEVVLRYKANEEQEIFLKQFVEKAKIDLVGTLVDSFTK